MDLLKNMNESLRYIEDNLTSEIDFKEVARIAYIVGKVRCIGAVPKTS